jgi:hypothetical protein
VVPPLEPLISNSKIGALLHVILSFHQSNHPGPFHILLAMISSDSFSVSDDG